MLRIPVATQKEAGRCIASFQQNGCALYGFFVNWLQCRVANTRTYHDDSTSFAMCARIDGKVSDKSRQFEHTVISWRSRFDIPEGNFEGSTVLAVWIWQHSWNWAWARV
ncbi:uncharacterized protein LOC133838221 isoform X1 [Drosophila sulfurigaster albostrigata]|uniref:uncharacterized protein LOC133838221 isoform X1 n=1 Tax=Drosophila sulfurigaster albostrigata TaxID=89887 RepID=UPI002D21B779|nr:uncharacterized protein LOC133838221 isoform X1 [Drosophila sulfurigaster albostrigata]